MTSLGDILAAMHDAEEKTKPMTNDQIEAFLVDCYNELRAENHVFEPGQLVVNTLGTAMPSQSGDQPMIFLGYIEREGSFVPGEPDLQRERIEGLDFVQEPSDFGTLAAALSYDCRVARVTQADGRAYFVPTLADTKYLKLYRPTDSLQ